ncbi:TPA: endolytic transglycosylase MltG [Candidatus Marinimicrobia bacterium]|nr:MAG: Aminodeoxychorismate lyase [Marinimicrobia bacterium 46_47]HAE87601.1 endolytic transglycosylase MltG [Candidatus Neomarinimicrobiota bacterium]HBY19045.1 endolytic transglycosylase MltG [Candidatus Neomarinimicrobiota bacterium]
MLRRFSPRNPNKREKLLSCQVFILILCVVIAGIFLLRIPAKEANTLAPDTLMTLHIPRGAPFTQIADSLIQRGLIESRRRFYWSARLKGKTDKLQAGNYRVPGGLCYGELVNFLSVAQPLQIRVTIPEGLEFEETAALLSEYFPFSAEDFAAYKDSVHLFHLPFKISSLEGFLFPETYDFYENATPREIIHRIIRQFLIEVDDSLRQIIHQKGKTVEEIITMASIIQGEAMIHDEMPIIASVYYNRLKRGMKLQADPTIQYIVPGPKIRLRQRHLEIDSPYNTYLYHGLPPGPVNSPGRDAILAAIFPDTTKYLYFVARGDGSHVFSRTHQEHLKAKAAFQQVRWEVYRQQQREKIPSP